MTDGIAEEGQQLCSSPNQQLSTQYRQKEAIEYQAWRTYARELYMGMEEAAMLCASDS